MYHFYESITNTKGDALTGYYVGVESSGATVDIFADNNGTPIVSESGVKNKARVDADGNVSFFLTAGTYDIVIYATDEVTIVKRVRDVAMQSGEPGASASITIGTVTTLSAGSAATVTNTGTAQNAVLNFGIPMGETGSGSSVAWGGVTGTLSNQTDLQNALNAKQPLDATLTALAGASWSSGTQVLTFTAADTVTLKTVGTAAGNILDKAAGDALYVTTATLANYAPALTSVVTDSANVTLSTTTHNNKILKLTGIASQTITLNSTPSAGHSTILFNNAAGTKTISAASGVYVNGASSTVTSITIADGGVATAVHLGSGVWLLNGSGLA